jgi:hypothetical protein
MQASKTSKAHVKFDIYKKIIHKKKNQKIKFDKNNGDYYAKIFADEFIRKDTDIFGNECEMDLSYNGIGFKGFRDIINSLDGNTNIHELCLLGNEISDKDMLQQMLYDKSATVLSIQMLYKIYSDYYNITTSSRQLFLDYNQIGDNIAKYYVTAIIKGSSKLHYLSLMGNNITCTGFIDIIYSLKNSNIKNLYLDENNLEKLNEKNKFDFEDDITTPLNNLELSRNHIGDNVAKYIGKIIEGSKKLEDVYLDDNNISFKGFMDIIRAKNISVTLSLGNNNIGKTDTDTIFNMHNMYTSLKRLELHHNDIHDNVALLIAEITNGSKQLQKINLSDNKIGDQGALAIVKSYQSHVFDECIHIYFENNHIEKEGLFEIISLKMKSPVCLGVQGNEIKDLTQDDISKMNEIATNNNSRWKLFLHTSIKFAEDGKDEHGVEVC